MTVINVGKWATPATEYPQSTVSNYRIHRAKYSRGFYRMSGLDDAALFKVGRAGIPVTSLQEYRDGRWKDWMVDDPPHWRAMQFYAAKAHGRVLTTGLGLGLVQHALAVNPAVESFQTVERSDDVWKLISPHVPTHAIIKDDWYEYRANTTSEWDTVIVDLWVAHDLETKMAAYHEATVEYILVKKRWPNATVFFHGFPQLCDTVWPMSENTRKAIGMIAREEE